MQTAIDQFRLDLNRVRNLEALHAVLSSQATSVLDLSDLLRAELVMVVSALDLYIHEVVRLGMLECFRGYRPQTNAFREFRVTLGGTIQALSAPQDDLWLDEQIRDQHSRRTFQNPNDIASGISLISGVTLWDSIAGRLQSTTVAVRDRLRLIVERRNKIVHEADLNPAYGRIGILWPITPVEADDAVTFVEDVTEAIHSVVV